VLKVRIIPVLLYRDYGLVKGVGFDPSRTVGNPMQAVKVYNLRAVDELVFFDVTATQQGRGPDLDLVDELADECFMPLTVGGGVRSIDDVHRLLQVGADKVSLGTSLVEVPGLLAASASRFGTQCMVASIDYRTAPDGTRRVWTRSGTVATELDPVELARRVADEGAGEILLTSIERDGTMAGYDVEAVAEVSEAVRIPVIAGGGAGSYADMGEALVRGGASAVAAASIFHFTQQTPLEAKAHLRELGLPVRV
jgi:cyclase